MANKVKYGLSNVYYAAVTAVSSTYTYDTPVALTGAVSLTLEADGDEVKTYADNVEMVSFYNNKGYTGELEVLLADSAFKKAVLGELEDTAGFVYEDATAKPTEFALMFQFEGDETERRYVLYRCKCSRPSVGSTTKGEDVEISTDKLNFTARPRITDKLVKGHIDSTAGTSYTNFFSAVYEPVTTPTPEPTPEPSGE